MGKIWNIYEKGVELLDYRLSKPTYTYPGYTKCENSKNTLLRGRFSYFMGEILNIYEK